MKRPRCPACGEPVTQDDAPVDGKHPWCDEAQGSLLDGDTILDVALALAERGLHVFPVDHPSLDVCAGLHGPRTPCDGQRGKHPAVHWTTAATDNPEIITQWFANGAARNIGVAYKPNRLVIFDEDELDELDRWCAEHDIILPPTFTVATGRGRHFYYLGPPDLRIGNSRAKAVFKDHGYDIDVRGRGGVGRNGGYVVGAGSLHETGVLYTIERDGPIEPLPRDVALLFAEPQEEQQRDEQGARPFTTPTSPGSGQDPNAAKIDYGKRHDALVSYAGRLRARGLDRAEAEPVFRERWLLCVQPPGTVPEARFHEPPPLDPKGRPKAPYPVTWEEARAKLDDVYARYPAGTPEDLDEVVAGVGAAHGVTTQVTRREADQVHSGQARLAYRVAAEYDTRLMYVPHVGWHWWDGQRWAEDAEGGRARLAALAVIRAAKVEAWRAKAEAVERGDAKALERAEWLLKDSTRCESGSAINAMLGLTGAMLAVPATELDANPHALNTPAGTLDLDRRDLRPHDPADRITKVTTGRPGASHGEWAAFLERVLPDDELRAFVQRLAGYTLLGCVREHILPLLVGVGANGKSTFYGALLEALGDYGGMAESDLLLVREHSVHPTREMDLRGKRLVVTTESEAERRMAEATVKRLTGGDPITARKLYRDFVTFTPSHTLMLVTNFPPAVAGDDAAVWRRLLVVPFDVVIPDEEQDEQLPERLRDAADEIVSWAIAGWLEYAAIGLDPPEQVRIATARYRTDNDSVARWLADDEGVQVNPHLACTTRAAFERFCRWHDSRDVGERAFGKALDRLGYPARKGAAGARYRHGFGLVEQPS